MPRLADAFVASGALVVCGGLAWAASQGVVFRDKDDNMSLSALGSWKTTRADDNTLSFNGTGNPFRGRWRDQGLVVTAQQIVGSAKKGPKGAYALVTATISGSVFAELARFGTGGASRSTVLTCARTTFTDSTSGPRLVASGSVVVTDTTMPAEQTTRLEGPSATIDLYPSGGQSKWPIRSASIPGPVRISLTTRTKDRQGAFQRATLVGTANSLTYDDSVRTLTLSGNVLLEGNDPAMGGTATARVAKIILDEDHALKEVEMVGDPGTSTLVEKKTP